MRAAARSEWGPPTPAQMGFSDKRAAVTQEDCGKPQCCVNTRGWGKENRDISQNVVDMKKKKRLPFLRTWDFHLLKNGEVCIQGKDHKSY